MPANPSSPMLDQSGTTPFPTDAGVETARLHMLISPEDDASVSVVVLNLPGAGSCGETEDEGIRNALEAVAGVVDEYESMGVSVPWRDSTHDPIPAGTSVKWVSLDA